MQDDHQRQARQVEGALEPAGGRTPSRAGAHGDGLLGDAEVPVRRQQQRLDRVGQVRARVGAGEPLDRTLAERAKPTCRVRHPGSEAPAHLPRQHAHRHAAQPAHVIAGGEPRPDHEIERIFTQPLDEAQGIGRVVLAVSVDLHDRRGTVIDGEAESRS